MNPPTIRITLLCAGLGAALLPTARSASADTPASAPEATTTTTTTTTTTEATPPPPASDAKDKEAVVLPQFTIKENRANPYISKQALSGTRIATQLEDLPQTISVVTSDLMKDTAGHRMLDTAKYVTPVVESTLPTVGDRYTIRGFQVTHEFIDGMVISGEDGYSMSLPTYNFDRIEIIKGPNAILVPGGAPGGQFNPITKSPIMQNQGFVTLDLAEYVGNALSTDYNYVVSKERGEAMRIVAALWRNDGYKKNFFKNGWEVVPSYSWQLSPHAQLILKGDFVYNDESQVGSLPLDPRVGSLDYAYVAGVLPRDYSFGNDQDHRVRETQRITMELLTTLSDHITSRLMLSGDHVSRNDQGGGSASIFFPNGAGGYVAFNPTRNPYTGLYEPVVTWTVDNSGPYAIATSTATPIPDPSTWIFRRINGSDHLFYTEAHLRNDYAFKFDNSAFTSTTIAGLAANFSKTKWQSWAGSSQGPDVPDTPAGIAGITYTPYNFTTYTQHRTAKLQEMQLYIYETASFFKEHLLLEGGVARNFGSLTRTDTTNIPVPGNELTLGISSTALSYGIIVRPIRPVSLYFSHNTSGETMPGSLQAGNPNLSSTAIPPYAPANGTQDEYGVKTNLLDGRLTASLCHFNITQTNYGVPNSEYYVLVSQGNQAAANLLPQTTFLNVVSKGWEAEGSFAFNKNLTVLGNWSDYEYRQPTGVRVRATPDRIWAAYVDYRFTDGALRNFGISLGVDSKSDMVGETAAGLTTTKPLQGVTQTYPGVAAGFVPQQASYKYDGRTLLKLGLAYRAKDWSASLIIDNLTDVNYVLAGGSRTAIAMGNPREFHAQFTYNY